MVEKTAKVWLGGRKGITAPIHLSQYDTGWRFLFSVYDGDAVYTGSEGTAIYLEGKKADGTVFAVSGTFSDGVAAVECTSSITSAVGVIDCELRISEDGETVGTANFEMVVEAAPLKGYTASGDDFSAIQQVLDGSNEAAASALSSKNAAAVSAAEAAVSAATAQVQAGMAYKIAASKSAMEADKTIGYVYVGDGTGADAGLEYGKWYYWKNNTITEGGMFVDPTGTVSGAAMDAKATGGALRVSSSVANNGIYKLATADIESGSWAFSTKTANSKRLRSAFLIRVWKGMSVVYTNPTMKVYFGVLETQSSGVYVQYSGWLNSGGTKIVYTINYDGWLTVILESTVDVTASDYDSDISIKAIVNSDENADIKTTLTNNGIVVYRHGGLDGSLNYYPSNSRVLIDYANYGGKTLRINVKQGYDLLIYNRSGLFKTLVGALTDPYYYLFAYSSTEWAFVARKSDAVSPITFDNVYSNISITEAAHSRDELFGGLVCEKVEFLPNLLFSSLDYTWTADRASSAPIKIPKSGLRITYNPEKAHNGTAPAFRVVCVKMTSGGYALCTTDADLLAESSSTTATWEPVYIPYIEDAYIIINTGPYDNTPANLNDAIWVYSGEIKQKGKLLGLHPMRVFIRDDAPLILWGTKQSIVNTTYYLGGFLWLKYAKSITVFPKYSVVANVYELNDDGTVTLKDSFWINETGVDAGRVAGVQHIDLTQYDFNGFVHFAVQCPVMYRARGDEAFLSYKTPIGMGVMSRYWDVYNNVLVEYVNNYQETVEQGLQPVLFENINKFMGYTFPLRLASTYVHEWEKGSQGHLFNETEEATPAFYAGAYDANSIFLNVTGKSYYTGMSNINSRCYQFARNSESYGRMGYGLTCSDFVSVLLGLLENYTNTALQFGSPVKFTRISDNWDYEHEMDMLKPGDVLSEWKIVLDGGEGPGEYTEGHCMLVYEKKYVNGQLEAIMLIESGYPYTRFTTLYNDKYIPITGEWQSFKRLADYKCISRLKPEYLEKIDEAFDLKRTYTPGTIMCDRGNGSIYCVNPVDSEDLEQGYELESPELLLTITDDEAEAVRIYKDGTLLDTVTIGEQTKNGYRVLDIRDYVVDEGLYTLKTDNSDDVQETFYVQKPMFFDVDEDVIDGTRKAHVPDLAKLRYMDVLYKKQVGVVSGSPVYDNWHETYIPEQFEADTPEAGKPWDETWGTINIPTTMPTTPEIGYGDADYVRTKLIYGTDYGTFQLQYMTKSSDPTATPIPVAYVEYSFGA